MTQQAGSALTMDDGQSHFDGIIFAELAPRKWMAGSEGFLLFISHNKGCQYYVGDYRNDRQAICRRVYPTRGDSLGVFLFAQGGTARFPAVRVWDLAPANSS